MGNLQSPESKLHYIERETNSVRASLRNRNITKQAKDSMVQKLAKQSEEVSELKNKVKPKHFDRSLKKISDTMHEVLEINPSDSQLDQGTVETDSFVQVPVNKRQTASQNSFNEEKVPKKKFNLTTKKHERPSLRTIQTKLETLKPEIETAINNGDKNRLRTFKETIGILASDLDNLDIDEETPLDEAKKKVNSEISKQYKKVIKAANDIKRDNNISYLKTQNQAQKATTELENIEKGLIENESLLDWAIKNNEQDSIQLIKNNIVKFNQQLNALDAINNDIKGRKLELNEKINSIVTEIETYTKKRYFEYNISQAKVSYDEIVTSLSKNSEDSKEEIKEKLENLYNFVNKLEGYNEITRNYKEELLTNIERLLGNVTVVIRKLDNQKVVQEIVEENVVLRKKHRRSNEVTQIDQFYNYWNNVKQNFDPNSYSEATLARLEAILQDMNGSIQEIKKQIVTRRNSRSNLLTQQSQSVPKLNKTSKGAFGSTRSLDTDGVIKTKARYYNIPTPEIKNVNEQLRLTYDVERSRFSKIEEIKTQVYYIREKLDEITDKEMLKQKLQLCLNQIQSFTGDSNQTIASNAKIVINDIVDLQNKLEVTVKDLSNGRMVTRNYGEILTEVNNSLELLYNEVITFKGTKTDGDYERLKLTLFELKDKLNSVTIPSSYNRMIDQREVLSKRISNYLGILENRVAGQVYSENEFINEKKNKLARLKGKVDRFNGTYKGVLYSKIEMDLNRLLVEVASMEDRELAEEIITETEKHLKILEQRASMAQSFKAAKVRTSKTEEQVAISKVKSDLNSIKKDIDRTPENQVDTFIGLKSRLDLVNLELDQISTKACDTLEKEKDIFVNETQTLMNVVNAKIALGQQPIHNLSLTSSMESQLEPKLDSIKELADITGKFNSLRNEVNTFFGSHADHRYSQLDNRINELISQTDQFKFITGTDLHMQKVALLDEMNYYHNILERKAYETEFIERAEFYVNDFEKSFVKNRDINQLEDNILQVQNTLVSARLREMMAQRKNNCLRKLSEMLEKIKQHKDSTVKMVEDRKMLVEVEEKLRSIKPEIETFVGLQSDNKFYELDETVMRFILKLDKFECIKGGELHAKKIALLKELHACGGMLDQRATDTASLDELENQISETSTIIDQYSGTSDQYSEIESHMTNIRKKLEHTQVNNDLVDRKIACNEKFSVLFNKFLMFSKPQLQVQTINKGKGYITQKFNFMNGDKNNVSDVLSNVNKRIEELKKQVMLFMDDEDSDEYKSIDNDLTELTFKLDTLNLMKGSNEDTEKINLMRYIQECTDILDERASEVSSLTSIEKKLDKINLKIQNEKLSDKDLDQLDEQLIAMQVKIGKLNMHPDLKNRKDQCASMVMFYLKLIGDLKNKRLKEQSVLSVI